MAHKLHKGLVSAIGTLWLLGALPLVLADQASPPGTEDSAALPQRTAQARSPQNSGSLREIIVTATKTGAQSIEDVPLAISAFTARALEASGSTQLSNLTLQTPGFTYSANGPWSIASIRGVGTNNVFAGGDPSTTVQVDGVYYGRPTGANLDFLDVERVEVLRGPQGTLYGRNAIAGTMNVITRDPSSAAEGDLEITAGSYGLIRPEFTISGPLGTDSVRGSISGMLTRHEGYLRELNAALPDQWNAHRDAFRGKLQVLPGPNVKFTLAGDYTNANEYFEAETVRLSPPLIPDGTQPGFFQASLGHPDMLVLRQSGISGTLVWNAGAYTLTSITAYRHSFMNLSADLDFTQNPIFTTRYFPENQRQLSQELDLAGQVNHLRFVAGAFVYREQADSSFNANVFNALLLTEGIGVTTNSRAVFAQGDYDLSDRLTVTLGARYTSDRKSAGNTYGALPLNPALADGGEPPDPSVGAPVSTIFRGSPSYSAFTPKIGLEFHLTDNTLSYASATRGFKDGGINLLIDPTTIDKALYDPERVWAYEGGIKTSLRGAVPGVVNLAAFHYNYTGLQVNQFTFTSSGVGQLVRNAPGASISGAELEVRLRPVRQLEIGATAAYLNARYQGSFVALDDFAHTSFDADGRRLNDAPQWTESAYGEFTMPARTFTVSLRAQASYKDRVYYTPLNDDREGTGGYILLNAGVRAVDDATGLELGIIGRNLANRRYLTATYYAFSSGGLVGEPRTIDVYLRYDFH